MNSERSLRQLSVAVSAAVLSLAASLAHAQQSMAKMPAMPASAAGVADHGSAALSQSMMSGMAQMKDMKSSGDTDKDFAMMMKAHHQQALEMAQIELSHGKSADLKSIARKIIGAQKKEIAEFDAWLEKHP